MPLTVVDAPICPVRSSPSTAKTPDTVLKRSVPLTLEAALVLLIQPVLHEDLLKVSKETKASHMFLCHIFSLRIENIVVDTHSEKEKGIFVSAWSGDQVWLLASPAVNTLHKLSDMLPTNCIIRPWQLNVCLPDGESRFLSLCGGLFSAGCWFSASFSSVTGDLPALKLSTSPGMEAIQPPGVVWCCWCCPVCLPQFIYSYSEMKCGNEWSLCIEHLEQLLDRNTQKTIKKSFMYKTNNSAVHIVVVRYEIIS